MKNLCFVLCFFSFFANSLPGGDKPLSDIQKKIAWLRRQRSLLTAVGEEDLVPVCKSPPLSSADIDKIRREIDTEKIIRDQ